MEIIIDDVFLSQLLAYSFAVVFVLVVWFKTDAVFEYLNLFGLGGLFGDYRKHKEKFGVSLPEYLLVKKDCFFSRLLECPMCLSVWLNLGFFAWHRELFLFFGGFYVSLLLYFLFSLLMKKQDG
jgi:hypothetical protein